MIAYESEMDGAESHVALVYGDVADEDEPLLVRVHTHCLAGEVFGETLCDCRALMDNALRMIAQAGRGALVYLHNGGRGFGMKATAQAVWCCIAERGETQGEGSGQMRSGSCDRPGWAGRYLLIWEYGGFGC